MPQFVVQDTLGICRATSNRVSDQCQQQILFWFRPDNIVTTNIDTTTPCLTFGCQECYDCLAATFNTSDLNATLWETLYPDFFVDEPSNSTDDDDDDSSSDTNTTASTGTITHITTACQYSPKQHKTPLL